MFFFYAGEKVAQYAINLTDSGGAPLEKSISLTGKALAGLAKVSGTVYNGAKGVWLYVLP